MLGAGQDLDRALRFLVETAPNRRVLATVEALRRTVRDGGVAGDARWPSIPRSFPRLYVGLVRAGEAGGTLAPTLEQLAALLERERSLAATVKSALIYPALLLVAAVGSIVLLLTQVLPQFVPLFEQSGAALPGPTQALIDAGRRRVGLWRADALVLLLLLVLLARQALQRPGPRLATDRLLLRLPVVGGAAARDAGGAVHPHAGHAADQRGAADRRRWHRAGRDRQPGAAWRRSSARDLWPRAAPGWRGRSRSRPVPGAHDPSAAAGRGDRAARPDGAARRGDPRGADPAGRAAAGGVAGAGHHHRHGRGHRRASSPR